MRSIAVWLAVVIVLPTVIVVAAAVDAQSSITARLLQPIVVPVAQQVPVTVVIGLPLADGNVLTTTVAMQLGVSLVVTLSGAEVIAVAPVVVAQPAAAAVAQVPAVQAAPGAPAYTVQAPEGITVLQVAVNESSNGTEFVGQLANEGSATYGLVTMSITVYDAAGALIDVVSGLVAGSTMEPGKRTTFRSLRMDAATPAEVGRYEIQIEGMPK